MNLPEPAGAGRLFLPIHAKIPRLVARFSPWGTCFFVWLLGACLLGCGPAGAVSASGGVGGTSNAGGGAWGGAGEDGSGGRGASDQPAPGLLSQTGLYAPDMVTPAPGVRFFEPSYQLWTDTAVKKRWAKLPEGAQIDTTNLNFWSYPVGTKLWKEFARDGVRVETRLLEKQPSGEWTMMAYHWRPDQMEADAVPEGLSNASGTAHDIPSSAECEECHLRVPDKGIGFSALQLAHAAAGAGELEWTLETLIAEGKLSAPPEVSLTIPGTPTEQAALGYLHANCGHCHNKRSSVAGRVNLFLWLTDQNLAGSVETTDTYASSVGQATTSPDGPQGYAVRIVPGVPEQSAIVFRMSVRGEDAAMPPLGTEDTDSAGLAAVEAWIASLATP